MASTIILKNGTGSAIPSTLIHGEPAINVNTGLFYYGSGSAGIVKTLGNFTDITASLSASLGGNISASGTITAEHIVSSDDIVASGELFTNGTGLNKIAGILTLGSSTIPTGGNNLKVTGTSTFTSHITASGDVSSSGKIYTNEYRIGLINFASVSDNTLIVGNSGANPIILGRANTTPITLSGDVTSSSHISSSGTITGRTLVATGNISASGNISATGHITSSGRIQTLSHITASGNISASGTIITEDLKVDTITNQTTGGGIILDSAGFIGLDSGGDIRFRDAGANQLHFDMDGTDGAQVISPSVAGDDIIFKNQGGDSVLTLKSEGQTEIHGHITASGNISSSGTITADDLHLPSTSPSTTSNLLYVSSSTAITGSRSANNLMYSGSMIGTGTGIIHIMHGSYKKSADHTTRTYISFGTGDKENTNVGNGYVRYHPPYGGKIRKFTAAGNLGGSKIGVVTFEFYLNGSIVSAATCTATVNPQDTMVDIDFNDAAIFDKGDKIQIALTSAAADGTDYFIYWNSVFEFNVN